MNRIAVIVGHPDPRSFCAALAVAGACKADMNEAASALGNVSMSPMRMQERRTRAGAVLLDDCYNANPTSMAAALDTLAVVAAKNKVAVLGEMAELADSEQHHRQIAARVAELGIELIAVGTGAYGTNSHTIEQAASLLAERGEGDAILVKGSRIAALERLVKLLV